VASALAAVLPELAALEQAQEAAVRKVDTQPHEGPLVAAGLQLVAAATVSRVSPSSDT
jgi:hypothetical protein